MEDLYCGRILSVSCAAARERRGATAEQALESMGRIAEQLMPGLVLALDCAASLQELRAALPGGAGRWQALQLAPAGDKGGVGAGRALLAFDCVAYELSDQGCKPLPRLPGSLPKGAGPQEADQAPAAFCCLLLKADRQCRFLVAAAAFPGGNAGKAGDARSERKLETQARTLIARVGKAATALGAPTVVGGGWGTALTPGDLPQDTAWEARAWPVAGYLPHEMACVGYGGLPTDFFCTVEPLPGLGPAPGGSAGIGCSAPGAASRPATSAGPGGGRKAGGAAPVLLLANVRAWAHAAHAERFARDAVCVDFALGQPPDGEGGADDCLPTGTALRDQVSRADLEMLSLQMLAAAAPKRGDTPRAPKTPDRKAGLGGAGPTAAGAGASRAALVARARVEGMTYAQLDWQARWRVAAGSVLRAAAGVPGGAAGQEQQCSSVTGRPAAGKEDILGAATRSEQSARRLSFKLSSLLPRRSGTWGKDAAPGDIASANAQSSTAEVDGTVAAEPRILAAAEPGSTEVPVPPACTSYFSAAEQPSLESSTAATVPGAAAGQRLQTTECSAASMAAALAAAPTESEPAADPSCRPPLPGSGGSGLWYPGLLIQQQVPGSTAVLLQRWGSLRGSSRLGSLTTLMKQLSLPELLEAVHLAATMASALAAGCPAPPPRGARGSRLVPQGPRSSGLELGQPPAPAEGVPAGTLEPQEEMLGEESVEALIRAMVDLAVVAAVDRAHAQLAAMAPEPTPSVAPEEGPAVPAEAMESAPPEEAPLPGSVCGEPAVATAVEALEPQQEMQCEAGTADDVSAAAVAQSPEAPPVRSEEGVEGAPPAQGEAQSRAGPEKEPAAAALTEAPAAAEATPMPVPTAAPAALAAAEPEGEAAPEPAAPEAAAVEGCVEDEQGACFGAGFDPGFDVGSNSTELAITPAPGPSSWSVLLEAPASPAAGVQGGPAGGGPPAAPAWSRGSSLIADSTVPAPVLRTLRKAQLRGLCRELRLWAWGTKGMLVRRLRCRVAWGRLDALLGSREEEAAAPLEESALEEAAPEGAALKAAMPEGAALEAAVPEGVAPEESALEPALEAALEEAMLELEQLEGSNRPES
eukprot:scaffold1.g5439.t1